MAFEQRHDARCWVTHFRTHHWRVAHELSDGNITEHRVFFYRGVELGHREARRLADRRNKRGTDSGVEGSEGHVRQYHVMEIGTLRSPIRSR